MQNIKRFRLPLYGVNVVFIAGSDVCCRFGVEMPEHFGAMVCIADSEVVFALRDENQYSTRTICHEAIHAAWRVCDLVGIKATSDNHEPLAYLAGEIARIAVVFFDKHYGLTEPKSEIQPTKQEQ